MNVDSINLGPGTDDKFECAASPPLNPHYQEDLESNPASWETWINIKANGVKNIKQFSQCVKIE